MLLVPTLVIITLVYVDNPWKWISNIGTTNELIPHPTFWYGWTLEVSKHTTDYNIHVGTYCNGYIKYLIYYFGTFMVLINSVILSASKNIQVIFLAHENHPLKLWTEKDRKLRIRISSVGFVPDRVWYKCDSVSCSGTARVVVKPIFNCSLEDNFVMICYYINLSMATNIEKG